MHRLGAARLVFLNELPLDLNECVLEVHNCDRNAFCFNKDGGYECKCKGNYFGNGTSCFSKLSKALQK